MRIIVLLLLLFATPARAQPVHGAPIRALAVLPDWTVASAGIDAAIILRRLSDGVADAVLRAHAGAVNALVALPDGGFASGGADGRIAVWSRTGTEPLRWLEGHTGPVAGLATDGDIIASASWDGTARIWATDGARVLEGHAGPVSGIIVLADGTPVTTGLDGTVRAWPEAGPVVLAQFAAPQNAIAALPGGVAVAGADGMLRLLAEDGHERAAIAAGAGPLVGLAVSDQLVAVASLTGAAVLVDIASARITAVVNSGEASLWAVAFTPDGATLITGGSAGAPRAWDPATARPRGPVGPLPASTQLSQADRGAQVFRACAVCHALTEDRAPRAGPSLHGLFGRLPGSLPGYAYSDALRANLAPWTPESVARLFEIGPQSFAPGTKMPEQVVADPADRTALVEFLQRATK